jgi:hypothetical protein
MSTGLVCQLAWYTNWLGMVLSLLFNVGMPTGLVFQLAGYGLVLLFNSVMPTSFVYQFAWYGLIFIV